jgi:predicted nucleic-acid-binding protein
MKIAVDTNVLLRLIVGDDDAQSGIALEAMERASLVAISVHSLCELVWVLDRRYAVSRRDIALTIQRLVDTQNVVVNRPAVDAGLTMLDAGGDFADGVIAYDGKWLGGETFVSFDKAAIKRLTAQSQSARLLQ